MLLSLLFGGKLIEGLRKWNIGQQIREEGPQGHMAKRGTPTMGGVLIVGSVIVSTLLWARLSSVYVWTVVIATLVFGAIGFADDYYKMAKQRSLGLTGKQKLLGQLLVAVGVWIVLFILTKYFHKRLFVEREHPVPESDGGSKRQEFYRPLRLPFADHRRFARLVQRGELDRRPGWFAISVTFIAMTALTGFTYLSQRCALGALSRVDTPA